MEKKCLKYPQIVKELLKKEGINNKQTNRNLSKADNNSNDKFLLLFVFLRLN